MSRLDQALERFTAALDRLEAAVAAHPQSGAATAAKAAANQRGVKELKDDRSRLNQELDTIKADYASLESLTDEVESRLDGAIREIRRALGS